jgi:uncharacterized protein YdhG (YjbR/CyaY superfamily)
MEQGEKFQNIDAYIAGFPVEIRERLEAIRATIQIEAPDAVETIKYRMPTFMLHGNMVYFAAFKKHIGLFSVPVEHADFANAVAGYTTGTGSIQFPHNAPLPLELIAALVAVRVWEQREKAV